MSFSSIFNYTRSSTPQTRADALLAMLREAPDAFNEDSALDFISRGIAHKNAADMLAWAALRGRTSVVCALIDKKIVKVDARDEYDDLALLNACYAGEHETIKALHKRHADITQTREGSKTAFHFAERSKVPGTYELLINLYPQAAREYEIQKAEIRKAEDSRRRGNTVTFITVPSLAMKNATA